MFYYCAVSNACSMFALVSDHPKDPCQFGKLEIVSAERCRLLAKRAGLTVDLKNVSRQYQYDQKRKQFHCIGSSDGRARTISHWLFHK